MGRLPNVYINITDGGLGILANSAAGVFAVVGVSSIGDVNRIAALSDRDQIAPIYGTGPLAGALADAFVNGARTILAVRAAGDIEGTIGTINKTGESTLTVTGKPLDNYEVSVEILTDGGPNEAIFQYSLDGKDTYSGKITIPLEGAYLIPNTGIQLTFAPAVKAGETYSFSTKAPQASVASIMAAVQVLLDTTLSFESIYVTGESSKPMWVAGDALANEATTKFRYVYMSFEAPYKKAGQTTNDWVMELIAAREDFASTRTQVFAGFGEVLDTLTGRQVLRSTGGHHRGQVATLKVQQSPGEVNEGSLKGIIKIMPEDLNPAHILLLDEAGYTTIRKYEDLNGIYITNGRMMAEIISDYQQEENRRLMDKVCKQVRVQALRFVKSGATERSIRALQAYLQHTLDIMQGEGELYSARIVIPPDQDIWATSKLRVKIRVVPVPIMREIELDLGLENPFLAAKLDE